LVEQTTNVLFIVDRLAVIQFLVSGGDQLIAFL
jgi:hypothetical protein